MYRSAAPTSDSCTSTNSSVFFSCVHFFMKRFILLNITCSIDLNRGKFLYLPSGPFFGDLSRGPSTNSWVCISDTFKKKKTLLHFCCGLHRHLIHFSVKKLRRFPGIHRWPFPPLPHLCCEVCQWLRPPFFFRESPFEYAEGGHGGSGTQGTL